MKIVLFSCLFFLRIVAFAQVGSTRDIPFETGDLLFQDLDCGGLCDAIEKVTNGADGKQFSHTGLVYVRKDSTFVIEAIGKDVHLTPLAKFINRQLDANGRPKVVHARLKSAYRLLNVRAIAFALQQLHTPYDDAFVYNNGKYYCSELIYDAYKYANKGKPFFELRSMTFNDPETGKPFPAWVDYYKELKLPIPEGKPGCNPGGLSTSNKVEILESLY